MPTTTPPDLTGSAQLAAQWARIRGRLLQEVGEVEYRTWLRQMTLAGVDGNEVTLHLPTRFLRDWVREHYADRLNALWQAENPVARRVDIRVGGGAPSALAESLAPGAEPRPNPGTQHGGTAHGGIQHAGNGHGMPRADEYGDSRGNPGANIAASRGLN